MLQALLPAAIEAGGSLISTVAGMNSANKQLEFQKEMRNTAHQREVADLRKAGLNPMLSAMGGSGASTPQGVSFTPENPVRGLTQNMIQARGSRSVEKQTESNVKTALTQQNLNTAAAYKQIQDAKLSDKQMEGVEAAIKRDLSQAQLNSANAILTDRKSVNEYNAQSESGAMSEFWRNPIFKHAPVIDRVLKLFFHKWRQ